MTCSLLAGKREQHDCKAGLMALKVTSNQFQESGIL